MPTAQLPMHAEGHLRDTGRAHSCLENGKERESDAIPEEGGKAEADQMPSSGKSARWKTPRSGAQ